MADRQNPTLSQLRRATAPYVTQISALIGPIASSIWMEEANLFEILDEAYMDAKFDAIFGMAETISSSSSTEPKFSSDDLAIARSIVEALHLSIDMAIILPRKSLQLRSLFERVVGLCMIMRSHQQGFDGGIVLQDIARAINEPKTARKLKQFASEETLTKLRDELAVSSSSFEKGISDGLWAIENDVLEPLDVIRFIGAGGEKSC